MEETHELLRTLLAFEEEKEEEEESASPTDRLSSVTQCTVADSIQAAYSIQ